ncbi:MAG: gfo/Idh/MocA family oxidoreductase, partial [Verrucomicrobia bacterium]|nr:gfo/Idh/MocA family oxidoreductase [Verrucomicrobiota bacterium]
MNNRSQNLGISRRRFLAAAGLAVAAPVIVPSSVLGADGATAPSNRITMASVGWGMQGPGNTGSFMNQKDCQVVAVCDLDKNHLERAANSVNGHYKNQDCKTYHDYREMLA